MGFLLDLLLGEVVDVDHFKHSLHVRAHVPVGHDGLLEHRHVGEVSLVKVRHRHRDSTLSIVFSLVVVDAEGGGAAEEGVVHEDVGGVVVGVRVPEAPRPHPDALAALLADHDLNHQL